MIKQIKNLLCAILISGVALSAFASCADSKDESGEKSTTEKQESGDNGAETTDDGVFYDAVPELDFGGYEYKVVIGEYNRENQELFPEEQISDILNDTIYKRNKKLEDRFNVTFKSETIDLFQLLPTLRKNVSAGDGVYDMYMQIDRDAYTAAGGGLLYAFDRLPHIDFSRPYWCRLPNKQLSVQGRLYWGFSDDMLSHFEATVVLYFNKKQVQDLGLDNLYGLVKDGAWTHDKFYEYAKLAVRDIDGDGKITEADYVGITSDADYFYQPIWISSGLLLVDKNDDDLPYFAVPGNEKFISVVEKAVTELNSMEGIYFDSSKIKTYPGSITEKRIGMFRAGYALFMTGAIQEMIQLRDMPDDFGIIPFPKYTADQPQYYTRVCGGFPYVIPATCENPELAGALLEAMACSARNEIIPAYYESALKTKYSRDPDTAEMLDLIFDTKVYDLGDTIWYDPIRIGYTGVFSAKTNSLTSFTEKNEEKYRQVIEKSVNAILDIG